jgi:hypothetical protein
MSEEAREEWDFRGCHVSVYEGNGKVVLWLEHSKPMALIVLAGFIHILGEPTDICAEDSGDGGFIFAFHAKKSDLRKQWDEVFGKLPSVDRTKEVA